MPAGVSKGKRFYERPGRVASAWVSPRRQDARESGERGRAPGREILGGLKPPGVLPGAPRNVAGVKMAAGQGGGRRGVSHGRAGRGRAAATVFGREDAAPSSCGGLRNGRRQGRPSCAAWPGSRGGRQNASGATCARVGTTQGSCGVAVLSEE